ncbi:NADH-quinone oxidoreductase subunit N [Herpetosiphon llansteffanensis]|uniref:NADH-quinone oxidoreductase subunit N n=1 Tax=Herpetosiphon llansteffanensis TaxID=2094568 RepID=UPI000D7BBE50|nr:NADH-quinone oxidoreductase subunit N [Herpetosiphon llansteffanensis]
MNFQIADFTRLIPEFLILAIAALVLLGDVLTRWSKGKEALAERTGEAIAMTLMGLGLAFVMVLIQGGFFNWVQIGDWKFYNFSIFQNLRTSGLDGSILGGAFVVDPLTHIGRLIFIGAAFVTVVLTGKARPSNNPAEFYALILFATLGMIFMTAGGELIMIYLGVELTSIPLYVLAGYFRRDPVSTEAGAKYYIFGALSSAILLFGMSLLLGLTLMNGQTMNATPTSLSSVKTAIELAFANPEGPSQGVAILGLLFILAGMAYKVAIVPFHAWSPDVYQGAPTSMTAFISTASKTAGFFLIYRVLVTGFDAPSIMGTAAIGTPTSFGGWTSLVAILASVTMLVGNLAALPQTNAKRMLAYSSIAQAGFLMLGLVGTQRDSSISLLMYLIAYTVTNLVAFGILALVEDNVGGTDFSNLNGLGRRSPGLALLLTVAILSLAGIPPLSGFFVKFYVFIAAWQEGAKWLVIFAVSNTVISLYYYLRFLKAVYFAPAETEEPIKVGFGPGIVMTALTLLIFGLGIVPTWLYGVLEQATIRIGAR